MSSGKGAKGKFINAFQSIQMISDYLEPEGPREIPKLETKVISVNEQFSINSNQQPFNLNPPPINQFQPFSVGAGQPYGVPNPPPFPVEVNQPTTTATNNLQDEIDKFVSETNSLETLQNGDELYNPLEDMDEGSDIDECQMIISNSPNISMESDNIFDINDTRGNDMNSTMSSYQLPPSYDDQSSIYPLTNTIELPSTFELPTSFGSPSSSFGQDDEDNELEMNSESELNNEPRHKSEPEDDSEPENINKSNIVNKESETLGIDSPDEDEPDDRDSSHISHRLSSNVTPDDRDSPHSTHSTHRLVSNVTPDDPDSPHSTHRFMSNVTPDDRDSPHSTHSTNRLLSDVTPEDRNSPHSTTHRGISDVTPDDRNSPHSMHRGISDVTPDDRDSIIDKEILSDKENDTHPDVELSRNVMYPDVELSRNSLYSNVELSKHDIYPEIELPRSKEVSENEHSGKEEADKEDDVDKQEEIIMKELEDKSKVPEIASNQLDFIDDNDELLGTALAELEQEEKEAEEELKKKLVKVKGAIKKVKKKKKKKIKNKDKENGKKEISKEEKKKKKKKKKKKLKEKDKDKADDSTKKKKKKSDKKTKEGKHTAEISISSVIKELNKEAKEKRSEPKKMKFNKIIKIEDDIPIVKHISKEKKKKEERRHKTREKKQDRKLYDRSNTEPERVKERKVSKDKKVRKEGKENKERRGRKRPSRDSSVEVEHKRSRKEATPEGRHKKRSRKSSKDRSRKKSTRERDDSSVERERRRSHVEIRKSTSVKERSPIIQKEVDYQIRLPSREKLHDHRKVKVKEDTPPKLSKEEFYEIQSKVRKLRGGKEDTRKHHPEDIRKVRENHEESRKFRDGVDDSHKENIDDLRKVRSHEDLRKLQENLIDSRRIRENLEDIRNFREKMNDSRKIRDTIEERKLRDNLDETRKLHDNVSRKYRGEIEDLRKPSENQNIQEDSRKLSDTLNDSRKLLDKPDDSRKHLEKPDALRKVIEGHTEIQKHNAIVHKARIVKKKGKLSSDSSQSDDDTPLTRSTLRENYSRELNRYRREHERTLQSELKQRKLREKQIFLLAQQEQERRANLEQERRASLEQERRANQEKERRTARPKSPPSPPPPPPPPRKRNDSNKSNSSDHHNQLAFNGNRSFSPGEEHEQVSEEVELELPESSPVLREEKQEEPIIEIPKNTDKDDDEKPSDVTGKLEIDLNHNSASPSEGEGSPESDSHKEMKPGFVSLRQYKQRKKSEQKLNQKVHRRRSSSVSSPEREVEEIEKTQTEVVDIVPETNEEPIPSASISPIQNENKETIEENNEVFEKEVAEIKENHVEQRMSSPEGNEKIKTPLSDEEESVANISGMPTVFSDEPQEKPEAFPQHDSSWDDPAASDADIASPIDSPYNPEFASPFDIGSPNIDNDENIDFRAYKDVVAFDDIMKSKVKQQARKHKRRKLEEMRFDLDGRGGSKRERKLVDHLIRQAQVEEEMKSVLKQYFRSRDITKDEYKNILKKAVPQVTMSNSPLIPEKIQSLMVKFVRKCKGQRMREEKSRRRHQLELAEQQKELQLQLQANAAMLGSLQPSQQIRVLNPNLPLPPMI